MSQGIRLQGCAITNAGSELEILVLPSNARDDVPITFHDLAGNDYQVPADTIFVPIYASFAIEYTNVDFRVGESDAADNAITQERIRVKSDDFDANYPQTIDPRFLYHHFAAGKYVTAETNDTNAAYEFLAGSMLIGLEFSTS